MKKRIVAFALLILAVLLIVESVVFFSRSKNNSELVLYGNVDVRQVDIGFRVAGLVDELYYEEGDFVREGALMCALDTTPYDSQVREAAATVDSTRVSLENAEKLLRRREELILTGGVSQEDLENAQANRDELKAALVQAQAALAVASDNLAYTKAFAPTDGIILTRIREPGTVAQPSDPVYTLSISSPVWIRAFVDESHLGDVFFGMTAEICTDTKGAPTYTGKVGFISPVSEFTPKTVETTQLRTDLVYRLRVYVDNPDGFLKQGMPVTVKLKMERQ